MNRPQDETSTALLSAAHRLLSEDGPEALTVRRIATEAGMSTMNVYSRFGGKDGVIDELFADGYRRLIEAINAVPTTDDVAGDMLATARAYRTFALANPTYYGVMFRSAISGFTPTPDSVELALGGLSSFVDRVRAGQERGEIVGADERDPTEVAAFLWATCHGMVSLELDGLAAETVSWPTIFEQGMRSAIAGLHPTATTSFA
jgi:AcrR family transcriptional regulator